MQLDLHSRLPISVWIIYQRVAEENSHRAQIPLQNCKDMSGVVSSMDKIDEYRNGKGRRILCIDKMGYIWQISTFCQG